MKKIDRNALSRAISEKALALEDECLVLVNDHGNGIYEYEIAKELGEEIGMFFAFKENEDGSIEEDLYDCEAALKTGRVYFVEYFEEVQGATPDDERHHEIRTFMLTRDKDAVRSDEWRPIDALEFLPGWEPLEQLADGKPLWAFKGEEACHVMDYGDVISNLFVVCLSLVGEGITSLSELSSVAKTRRKGRRKGTANRPKLHGPMKLASDPFTRALMKRGEGSFSAWEYFADNDGRKNERQIRTTGKGHITASVSTSEDTDLGAPIEEFRCNNKIEYWLNAVYSFAQEGVREIKGSDLLRAYGYKNPFDHASAETMAEAATELFKARREFVTWDASDERRRGENSLLEDSRGDEAILGGAMYWETYTNGTRDFVIKLPETEEPFAVLPLARFADDRNMIHPVETHLFEFKNAKPQRDARRAWAYILGEAHRANKKTRTFTILLDTMWNDLELDPPKISEVDSNGNLLTEKQIAAKVKKGTNEARKRMLKTLERMLSEKSEPSGNMIVNHETGKKEPEYQPYIEWFKIDDAAGKITIKLAKKEA